MIELSSRFSHKWRRLRLVGSFTDGVFDTGTAAAVRALNTLNVLFRDSGLSDTSQHYAANAMIIAISGFAASNWALSNACTILFGTLAQKMLGAKRVRDDRSHVNLITAREFFARYPQLHKFATERLRSIVFSTARFVEPELYPLLSLFGRLQSNADADPEQTVSLVAFTESLSSLTENNISAIRGLAARALVPMAVLSKCGDHAVVWLKRAGVSGNSANGVHGALLCAQSFIRVWLGSTGQTHRGDTSATNIGTALTRIKWLTQPQHNSCAVISALYIDTCREFFVGTSERRQSVSETIGPGPQLVLDVLRSVSLDLVRADHHVAGNWLNRTAVTEAMWHIATGDVCCNADDEAFRIVQHLALDADPAVRQCVIELALEAVGTRDKSIFGVPGIAQLFVLLCYNELASPTTACSAIAVELFEKLCNVDQAPTFPLESPPSISSTPFLNSGSVSSTDFWDRLCSVGSSTKNARLKEASLAAMGHMLDRMLAESSTGWIARQHDAVKKWIVGVKSASAYTEASTLRAAAARSVAAAAPKLFSDSAMAVAHGTRLDLLEALIRMLQDEDEEVRAVAAETASKLPALHTRGVSVAAQPNWNLQWTVALESCFNHVLAELESEGRTETPDGLVDAWDRVMSLMGSRGPSSCQMDDNDGRANAPSEGDLFVKEDSNTFVEPMYEAQLGLRTLLCLLNSDKGEACLESNMDAVPSSALTQGPIRAVLRSRAQTVAQVTCTQLMARLQPPSVEAASVPVPADLVGRYGYDLTGRNWQFQDVYCMTLTLAATVYTLGACHRAEADASDHPTAFELPDEVQLAIGVLQQHAESKTLPSVLVKAVCCIADAYRAWAPTGPCASTREVAFLLASQVAALATHGVSAVPPEWAELICNPEPDPGDTTSDVTASPTWLSSPAWDCPYNGQLKWSFLCGDLNHYGGVSQQ